MEPDLTNQLAITAECPARWITVGVLLDVRNRRVLKNAHLVFNDERIIHVGGSPPAEVVPPGRTAPDLTLDDFTAIPGLIDGHIHTFLEGAELEAGKRALYQKQDPQTLYEIALPRVQAMARMGIIAMRDGGDKDRVGLRLSQLKADPARPPFAAEVFSPGAGIYRLGRYGGFFGTPVEDYPSIECCVQARVADGADHIKIVPTGIINFAKGAVVAKPQFSVGEVRQFKCAALAHGKHVMAHASGDTGVGIAIDGGVDTIEHGFFITREQLAKMRDGGTSWVPTFAPVQEQLDHADVMGWSAEVCDNLRMILENHARSLQQALLLGVKVLVGSDAGSCGVAHGCGMFYEMELLEAAGMPTLDILCQATHGNNVALTGNQPYGALEAGLKPRFILTKHQPLATVRNLRHERIVVFDGDAASSNTVRLENL